MWTTIARVVRAGVVALRQREFVATDYVYGMGGLALYFLRSIGQADPFAMTAILVVIGGIVAVFILLADLAVGWLEPRARNEAAG